MAVRPVGACRGTARALPALTLAVLMVVLSLAAAMAAPARPAWAAGHRPVPGAAVDSGPLMLVVSHVGPAALRPTSTLSVTGTITNTSDAAVRELSTVLAFDAAIHSRVQLAALRMEPPTSPTPLSVPSGRPRTLAAGRSIAFTLTLTNVGQHLPAGLVSLLSVVVSGQTRGDALQPLARSDLAVPYFEGIVASPLRVSLVLPVFAPPVQGPADVPSPSFLASLTDGPLHTVVTAAAAAASGGGIGATELTLAVDPALLARVCALAGRCDRRIPAGTPAAATTAAQAWFDELVHAVNLPSVQLAGLPYADADLTALAASHHDTEVTALLAAADHQVHSVLTTAGTAEVQPVLPPSGELSPSVATDAEAAGTDLAVVDEAQAPVPAATSAATPPTPTATTTLRAGGSGLTALVTDATLQGMLTPAAGTPPQEQVQALLGELGVITSERPSGAVRTVVLETPRVWTAPADFAALLVHSLPAVPYVTSVNLQEAAAAPATPRAAPRAATVPALAADVIDRALGATDQVALLHELASTPSTETLSDPYAEALRRAISQGWRNDPSAGRKILDDATAGLTQALGSVTLGANTRGGVLLTGASGVLPVAASNGLPESVTVLIHVASDPVGQVSGRDVRVTLSAGALRQQVSLPISARSSRRTSLTVSLLTSAGRATGVSLRVPVRSTSVGLVAVGITAGALTVLVLAIVIRLVRRRAGRGPGPDAAAPLVSASR